MNTSRPPTGRPTVSTTQPAVQPGRLRRRLRLQHRNQHGPGGSAHRKHSRDGRKDHLWPIDNVWDYHAGGGVFKDLHVFTDALNARFGPATSAEDYAVKVADADLRRRPRHVRGLQPQQVHLDRRDPVDAEQRLALDDLAPLRLLPAPGRRLFRRQAGHGAAASGVWLRRPLRLVSQQPVCGRQGTEAHGQGS